MKKNIIVQNDLKSIHNSKNKRLIVFTPNAEHLVRINNSSAFKMLYKIGNLFFCDSSVLQFIFSRSSNKIERITGVDILTYIIKTEPNNYFIIGGNKAIAKKIGKGKCEPSIIDTSDIQSIEYITNRVRKSKKQFIILCLSAPKQEILVNILAHQFPELHFFCLGNSANFYFNQEKRIGSKIKFPGAEAILRTILYKRIRYRMFITMQILFLFKNYSIVSAQKHYD